MRPSSSFELLVHQLCFIANNTENPLQCQRKSRIYIISRSQQILSIAIAVHPGAVVYAL